VSRINGRLLTTFLSIMLGAASATAGLNPGTAVTDQIDAAYKQGYQNGVLAGKAQCLSAPQSCNITLGTLINVPDLGETEPNENAVGADPIASGKTIQGQSKNSTDKDWFWLTTPSNNALISVIFKIAGIRSTAWTISVRDRAGNIVGQANVVDIAFENAEGDLEASFDVTVGESGTYYIVVEPFGGFSSLNYLLTAVVTETDQDSPTNPGLSPHDAETEDNNNWSRADLLASGVSIVGQLSSANDEDWYVIASNGDEIISFDFCGEECSTNWMVFVIDGGVDKDVLDNGIEGIPSIGQPPINAIEYLFDRGALGNSVIDSMWIAQEQTLNIGIHDPGIYYFVVAPVWRREDGALNRGVVQEEVKETVVIEPERQECPAGANTVTVGNEITCVVAPKVCEGTLDPSDLTCNFTGSDEKNVCPKGSTDVNGTCVVKPDFCRGTIDPKTFTCTYTILATDNDCEDGILCPIGSQAVSQTGGLFCGPGDTWVYYCQVPGETLGAAAVVCPIGASEEQLSPLSSYCTVPVTVIPAVTQEVIVQPQILGGLLADPFSTDEYNFTVRRTALSPTTGDSPEYSLYELRATYNPSTYTIHIPQLSVGGAVYSADLVYIPGGPTMNFQLKNVVPID